jgi:hypothetical protein
LAALSGKKHNWQQILGGKHEWLHILRNEHNWQQLMWEKTLLAAHSVEKND